jgi:hypothetical protein
MSVSRTIPLRTIQSVEVDALGKLRNLLDSASSWKPASRAKQICFLEEDFKSGKEYAATRCSHFDKQKTPSQIFI